jgi:gliding motility-associated-like protein
MNKSNCFKIFCALAILSFQNKNMLAQLTVNSSLTPTQLVQNVLLGTGITATNITYSGDLSAKGSFTSVGTNIGFSQGVILASGDIANAIGPNTMNGSTTNFFSPSNDVQLNAIATGDVNDAAVLEFDFVPQSDSIKFKYVFASEEYPDYVCSDFNDVFGFFITGPNPFGTAYTNYNIARIPNSTFPVAINTVNPGVAGANSFGGTCQSLAYSNLYISNNNGATIEYNGFTIPLIAKAPVVCGQTYHIKVAIADVFDGNFDSGVFLEKGSFSSLGVNIATTFSYGGPNDSVLYEGCGSACVKFIRTSNLNRVDTVNITIAGNATNGVDYNTGLPGVQLPNQVIFQVGVDTISYCINSVSDAVTEGLENISLSFTLAGFCVPINADIFLDEFEQIAVATFDSTLCNQGGNVLITATASGGVPPYTYAWSNSAPSASSQIVNVTATTNYSVTVSDACTNTTDPTPSVTDDFTITVQVFDPLVVSAGDDFIVCPDDQVNISALVSGGSSPYSYTWSILAGNDSLNNFNANSVSYIASTENTYQISIVDRCSNTTNDAITIEVENGCTLNLPNIITPDGNGTAINEKFYIQNLDKFPQASLLIYNRWGNKIYESENYKNDWNAGKHAAGTYYYVLSVSASTAGKLPNAAGSKDVKIKEEGDKRTFTGFFQIARLK